MQLISQEVYTIIILMIVTYTAIMTPIIHCLYDPSKKYLKLPEEVNPAVWPIGAFVLELMELVGQDHLVLINSQFHRQSSYEVTRADRIISTFCQHELQSEGTVKYQHFKAITPYATMHDDIFTVALEKNAYLLIMPFYKSEGIGMRGVTRNLLDKAPCSVGLLVNRKIIMPWRSDYKIWVCVVSAGRPCSCEALAYGPFMAGNPAIRLTVVHLIPEDDSATDSLNTRLDAKAIQEFCDLKRDNERFEYREVTVRDGAETSRVLLSLNNHDDFLLAGRRLELDSPLVAGLSEWDYVKELGVIGDILA